MRDAFCFIDTCTVPSFAPWTEETLLPPWWWLLPLPSSIPTGFFQQKTNFSPDSICTLKKSSSQPSFSRGDKRTILNGVGKQTRYHSSKLSVFQLRAEKVPQTRNVAL